MSLDDTLAALADPTRRAVVDLLRRARPHGRILPAVIGSGARETIDGGFYRVPKRDIIVGLQVLLQSGGLRIAAGLKHGPALVKEMANMQVKVTAGGYEQYGAWREGTHDDLVFAVGLSCWAAKKMYPGGHGGEGRWWRNSNQDDAQRAPRRLL